MHSIQEVAKMTGLTSRALRLYEEVGILYADQRSSSGARIYSPSSVERLSQIVAMKSAGITLREVAALLVDNPGDQTLQQIFKKRLEITDSQISALKEKKQNLEHFLSMQESLPEHGMAKKFRLSERERVELFALDQLERTIGETSDAYASYLKDELSCFNALPETYALIPAIKKVVDFAATHKIPLGPGRGSAAASLVFHLIGFSKQDPVRARLKPAVVFSRSKAIWTDVPFSTGKPVVELCEELSESLAPWRIEAFRLPILDIIQRVHQRIGHEIAYDAIADDSPEVLSPFQNGDCEKILWFDEPETTLAARIYPEQLPEWAGFARMNEYLKSQPIISFQDVLNIQALRRPKSDDFVARMHEYAERKKLALNRPQKPCETFRENFGMVIYHEDIIDLIEQATSWDALHVNLFRYSAFKGELTENDRREFLKSGTESALAEIEQLAPFGFSKAHIVAHGRLVKCCAILKNRYRDIYMDEVSRWENEHGLSWSDFGFRDRNVCLLK